MSEIQNQISVCPKGANLEWILVNIMKILCAGRILNTIHLGVGKWLEGKFIHD